MASRASPHVRDCGADGPASSPATFEPLGNADGPLHREVGKRAELGAKRRLCREQSSRRLRARASLGTEPRSEARPRVERRLSRQSPAMTSGRWCACAKAITASARSVTSTFRVLTRFLHTFANTDSRRRQPQNIRAAPSCAVPLAQPSPTTQAGWTLASSHTERAPRPTSIAPSTPGCSSQ